MAAFKVGDKVRIVSDIDAQGAIVEHANVGMEAVILARGPAGGGWDWHLYVPNAPDVPRSPSDDLHEQKHHFADSCQLAPLTDPKADSFIESLKKLAREPPGRPQMPEKLPEGHRVAHLPTGVFMLKPDPLNAGKWLAVAKLYDAAPNFDNP